MRGIVFVFALIALSISAFALPDLIVQDIAWTPGTVYPGTQSVISVDVKNIGNTTVNSSVTVLYIDGTYDGSVYAPSMFPQESYTANFSYNVTNYPNPHNLTAIADYYNTIAEPNEYNNVRTEFMPVSQLQLCGDGWCNGTETNATCPSDCNYLCGDANGDHSVNIADAVFIINYVFTPGSPAPVHMSAADVDKNGMINVGDAVYMINYIFSGGPAPCSPPPTWNPAQYSSYTQAQVMALMNGPSCGDGTCNGNETCSTCPQDCGICQNCTPSWFCRDAATKAYRSATCQVTYFPCGGYFCCKNGVCVKDLKNTCRSVVISDSSTEALSAETSLTQVRGPSEELSILAVLSMVVLVSVVLYAFIKIETHL